jgi:hypothetical protein
MESYRMSTGQGRPHLHSHHRISNLSSIVKRLASRSLTGRGLDIKVHQHYGFRLHLVWEWKRDAQNCKPSESCFVRNFFDYKDLEKFCNELVNGGLEGLCDCVSEDIYLLVNAKRCCRGSQNYLFASRKVVREKQVYEGFCCLCPVSSAYTLEWS